MIDASIAPLLVRLQTRLEAQANEQTKQWWEKYMKGAARFRGVKMAQVRGTLHSWYAENRLSGLPPDQRKEPALALFAQPYTEDKLAGILFLQEILLPAGEIDWRADLPRFAALFDSGQIADWNVCDWFCVKVLGPLVEREGADCARAIADWQTGDTLWQRRAAAVAFVNLAAKGDDNFPGFIRLVLDVCAALVEDPARFAHTGAGWVLRELSVADPQAVDEFVTDRIGRLTAEGVRYATAKLPEKRRKELAALHKQHRKTKAIPKN